MTEKKSTFNLQRKIALCYVRKSWTRSKKDEISPKRQRDHIQAICNLNGWQPEWYQDIDGHRSGMYEKIVLVGSHLRHVWAILMSWRWLQMTLRGYTAKAGELAIFWTLLISTELRSSWLTHDDRWISQPLMVACLLN